MTEKRFKLGVDEQYGAILGNDKIMRKGEIVELLNELYEENEQLKQQMQTILKLTKKIEDCTYDIKLIGDVE